MKYYNTINNFKFSWDEVSTCFWNRYPNPFSSHVTSEDTVWRKVVDGKLISQRLITKVSSVPTWTALFLPGGVKKVCVLEESIVDPVNKTLTTYTHNLGMTKVMMVEEKCVYTPDPDNKSRTLCKREAWINSSLYGFSTALKSAGIERFKKTSAKTVKGFEHALNLTFRIPDVIPDQSKILGLNTDKFKESKDRFKESAHKAKESAHKAKESAKELAKQKAKSASVTV